MRPPPLLLFLAALAAALLCPAAASSRALLHGAPTDFVVGGSLRAKDWSYATQVPPAEGPNAAGFCRRVDAGGAIVLALGAPMPAAGAKVRLRLAGDPRAPGVGALELSLADGDGGAEGRPGKRLADVLGGGAEATVPASELSGGGRFDRVRLARPDLGADIVAVCIDHLAVEA
jgi:hypothetical protein